MIEFHKHLEAAAAEADRAAFEIGLAVEWSTPAPRPALSITLFNACDALLCAIRQIEAAQDVLDAYDPKGDPK